MLTRVICTALYKSKNDKCLLVFASSFSGFHLQIHNLSVSEYVVLLMRM